MLGMYYLYNCTVLAKNLFTVSARREVQTGKSKLSGKEEAFLKGYQEFLCIVQDEHRNTPVQCTFSITSAIV